MIEQENTAWVGRLLASASPWRDRARGHPMVREVAGMLDGSLSGPRAAAVNDHLLACAACAAEADILRQTNTDHDPAERDALPDPEDRVR